MNHIRRYLNIWTNRLILNKFAFEQLQISKVFCSDICDLSDIIWVISYNQGISFNGNISVLMISNFIEKLGICCLFSRNIRKPAPFLMLAYVGQLEYKIGPQLESVFVISFPILYIFSLFILHYTYIYLNLQQILEKDSW